MKTTPRLVATCEGEETARRTLQSQVIHSTRWNMSNLGRNRGKAWTRQTRAITPAAIRMGMFGVKLNWD